MNVKRKSRKKEAEGFAGDPASFFKQSNHDNSDDWLWHRQLLRHEKLRWVWRRIRVGRLCYCIVAPLETAFYLHKLFSELLFT